MTTGQTDRSASETQLIARITRAVPSIIGRCGKGRAGQAQARLGIGDDAAVVTPGGRNDWVLSCDAFLDGVHFLGDRHPADSVGFKSLARATSDLAAMGATPRFFLLTLALPLDRAGAWLDQFLQGMARAARSLGIRLLGGDTKRYPAVAISITVIGEIAAGKAVPRSGARPGDVIYVGGTLGRAELGLQVVRRMTLRALRAKLGSDRSFRQLLQPHLYPNIRLALGAWLARTGVASAMMDISDGLSTDLDHICTASGVAARVRAERIPCVGTSTAQTKYLAKLKLDPLELALHGGEDYELLFTVPPKHAARLRQAPGFAEVRPIGEIERGKGMVLIGADGRSRPLKPGGWDPFR